MTELKKYFDKNKDDRNVSCMLKLVHAVSSAGGKAYVVGGFVRDAILGQDNKDIDFEIHGLDASTIDRLQSGLHVTSSQNGFECRTNKHRKARPQ